MRRRSRFQMLVPVILLGACSASEPPPAQTPPPAKTVFDPMTQQIDRARAVQSTVDQHTDDTRKRVEAAEGAEASP